MTTKMLITVARHPDEVYNAALLAVVAGGTNALDEGQVAMLEKYRAVTFHPRPTDREGYTLMDWCMYVVASSMLSRALEGR